MKGFKISLFGIGGTFVVALFVCVSFYFFLQSGVNDVGEEAASRDYRFDRNAASDQLDVATAGSIDTSASALDVDELTDKGSANPEDMAATQAPRETASHLSGFNAADESQYAAAGTAAQAGRTQMSIGAAKLFDLIRQLGGVADQRAMTDIRSLFNEYSHGPDGSEFVQEMLEAYGAGTGAMSQHGTEVLQDLLATSEHGLVGEYALDQLEKNGIQASLQWLDLTRDLAAVTPDVNMSFLAMLPDFKDPVDIAIGIATVGSHAIPSSVESMSYTSAIAGFAAHEDERVRAAAAATVGSLAKGHSDYRYILENALTDPSSIVRAAALSSIVVDQIQSDIIKKRLFELLRDDAMSSDQKRDARLALQNQALNEHENAELLRHGAARSLANASDS